MENLNVDDDEEVPGLGRGGGGQWWNWASLAVSLGIGAALWWRNRQLARESQEMKIQISRAQCHIRRSQNIGFYSSMTNLFVMRPFFVESSEEEKEKVVDTVLCNKLLLYCLGRVDELEDLLVERQHIFCSSFRPKSQRLQIEEQIFEQCERVGSPHAKAQLKKVLESDRSCGSCLMYLWSGDKRRNGSSMWTFLKELKEEAEKTILQGHKFPKVVEDPWPKEESDQAKD